MWFFSQPVCNLSGVEGQIPKTAIATQSFKKRCSIVVKPIEQSNGYRV